MAGMTISGLAREGGVGVETVRYYQRRGLLPEPARPRGSGSVGGVRRYGDDDVRRLRFIRSAQSAGFSLEDIGALLAFDASTDRRKAREIAHIRLGELDRRIAGLQAARAWLSDLERICGAEDDGPRPIIQAFERASDGPVGKGQ